MSTHEGKTQEAEMEAWIIERMEQEKRDREWTPEPLRIQQPPPEWLEEQARRRDEKSREDTGRGVWIFEM
jgi:hypothetical protein